MNDEHLTASDLHPYVENELDEPARAEIEKHIRVCAPCRGREARERRLSRVLRTMPRQDAPRDLAARIGSAVEAHLFQERLRRSRMPFIAVAMCFSVLLLVWFGLQMIIAFEDNGTLEFVSLLASRPDVLSTYSIDAVWALIEALPLGEIALTLLALFTAFVLLQQWIDTVRPRTSYGEFTHAR